MNPIAFLETGVLYCDDNLKRLAEFPDDCVDLIYLDPPFFSNRNYEVIWHDDAEVRSFNDRWEGGINHYLSWMDRRLPHLHRILKPTGSLYLHCDPSASHYLKVRLDAIFGIKRFRNEIAWKRFSAKNDPKRFGRSHDTILFYTKGPTFTWHPQYGPFEDDYVDSNYRYLEEGTGRRYRLSDLTANKPGGDTDYEWHGAKPYKGRHWAYGRDKMDQMLAEGRIVFRKTGMPVYKRYLDEQPGVPLQDVWTDIRLTAGSRERIGYPTQKPEALLARILAASTSAGDVVLDPFCGCGTTVAVAQQLQRRWIGIDISPRAVEIIKRRVAKLGASPKVYGLPQSLTELRAMTPRDFQRWVIERVNGHHQPRHSGDMGIDGFEFFERLPIQVKQSERVGRGIVDTFETAIERAGKHKGFIVGFSFTRGAIEAARVRRERDIEVVLVKAEDVVRVGELIDTAARDHRVPDVSEYPDLMGLFRDLQRAVEEREDYLPRPSASRRRRTRQPQLPGLAAEPAERRSERQP